MGLAARVNDQQKYVASLDGAGYLSAHLNLSNRPKTAEATQVLRTTVERRHATLVPDDMRGELL